MCFRFLRLDTFGRMLLMLTSWPQTFNTLTIPSEVPRSLSCPCLRRLGCITAIARCYHFYAWSLYLLHLHIPALSCASLGLDHVPYSTTSLIVGLPGLLNCTISFLVRLFKSTLTTLVNPNTRFRFLGSCTNIVLRYHHVSGRRVLFTYYASYCS